MPWLVRFAYGSGVGLSLIHILRGYVDYICPQLYVNFENPVLPYDVAAEQWREMTTDPNVKLYFGLAVYLSLIHIF